MAVMTKSVRAYLSERGRLGGKARAAKLTADERKAIARRGADARWSKVREAKAS